MMHLENTLIMYRIYNAETLEKFSKNMYMPYIADNHYMKLHLLVKPQQPTKHASNKSSTSTGERGKSRKK